MYVQMANGALCSFLLKQRQLLRCDYNGFCRFSISSSSSSACTAAAAAAAAGATEARQKQLLLLQAIDTILVKLLVSPKP